MIDCYGRLATSVRGSGEDGRVDQHHVECRVRIAVRGGGASSISPRLPNSTSGLWLNLDGWLAEGDIIQIGLEECGGREVDVVECSFTALRERDFDFLLGREDADSKLFICVHWQRLPAPCPPPSAMALVPHVPWFLRAGDWYAAASNGCKSMTLLHHLDRAIEPIDFAAVDEALSVATRSIDAGLEPIVEEAFEKLSEASEWTTTLPGHLVQSTPPLKWLCDRFLDITQTSTTTNTESEQEIAYAWADYEPHHRQEEATSTSTSTHQDGSFNTSSSTRSTQLRSSSSSSSSSSSVAAGSTSTTTSTTSAPSVHWVEQCQELGIVFEPSGATAAELVSFLENVAMHKLEQQHI